jgi:hypothetical protein
VGSDDLHDQLAFAQAGRIGNAHFLGGLDQKRKRDLLQVEEVEPGTILERMFLAGVLKIAGQLNLGIAHGALVARIVLDLAGLIAATAAAAAVALVHVLEVTATAVHPGVGIRVMAVILSAVSPFRMARTLVVLWTLLLGPCFTGGFLRGR